MNTNAKSRFTLRSPALIAALMLALLMLAGCGAAALPLTVNVPSRAEEGALSPAKKGPKGEVIRVEVVDNPNLFVLDEAPVYEDGAPAHGNTFITQGYIYPEGTLNGSNGVLPNGEPEFPDKVLGTWICRGWFINEAGHAEEGPIAFTTQFFDFNESYDNATIVTEGYETISVNAPFARAITGGSGQFADARGEAIQELLGFTDEMAVNLSMEIRLNK